MPTSEGRTAGGTGGTETQLEAWRDELQKRLEAERHFFTGSTAEELGFWQSKLALTEAGSRAQAEVNRTIYELERRLARQNEQQAEAALDAKKRVADAAYQRQVQRVEAEEKLGKLSASQALAQEQHLLEQKWELDQQYYAKKKAAAEGDTKTGQQIDASEAEAYQAYLSEKQKLTDEAAEHIHKSWEDAIKPIADDFARFATDVILRTKSIAAAFDEMMRSILDSALQSTFKGFINSALGIGGGSGSGSGGSGGGPFGIGSVLGSGLNSLMGDALKAAIGNPFSGADTSGLLGGTLGNPFSGASGGLFGGSLAGLFGGGGSSAEIAAGFGSDLGMASAGGFTGFLQSLPLIGAMFMAKGGIVPSAAGGWSVPSLGPGGQLSVLHSREMVLPANISEGLQSMIGAGGAGHTFNIGINAVDAGSVQRLFMANGSALVAALNKAMRNGSMLSAPS